MGLSFNGQTLGRLNYAGGIDGTALRCVLRLNVAHEQWSLATVDVKCAFLLVSL